MQFYSYAFLMRRMFSMLKNKIAELSALQACFQGPGYFNFVAWLSTEVT